MKKIFVLLNLVLMMVFSVAAQQFPKSTGLLVNDFANIIPDELQMSMETKLRDFERKTSIEVAVVTVDSLGGVTIEEYANKLFHEWGIGKKEADNGVLFIVSMQERKMRIETGYGSEALLPDAICKRITGTMVVSRFKEGAYGAGILSGTNGILEHLQKALDKERALPVSAPVVKEGESKDPGALGLVLAIGVIILFSVFFRLFIKRNRKIEKEEEEPSRAFEGTEEVKKKISDMAKIAAVGAVVSAVRRSVPSKRNDDDVERRLREEAEEERRRKKKREDDDRRKKDDDDDDYGSGFGFGGGGHDDGGGGGFDFGGGDSGGGGASDSW